MTHISRTLSHMVKRELPWGIYKTDALDQRTFCVFRARSKAEAMEQFKRLQKYRHSGESYRIREDCQ